MPGNRIGPEGPDRRAVLATRDRLAQARDAFQARQNRQKSGFRLFFALRSPPIPGRSVPYRWSAGLDACSGRSFTESTIFLAVPNAMRRALAGWAVHVPSRLVYLVYSWPQNLHSDCPGMNDDRDKRGRPTGPQDSRQERLKLALRENLKRRKSQARGRSDAGSASSGHEDAALDDASGKKPVR
jgi:hypothetical protein